MIVDRAWAERNIGFDPAKTTPQPPLTPTRPPPRRAQPGRYPARHHRLRFRGRRGRRIPRLSQNRQGLAGSRLFRGPAGSLRRPAARRAEAGLAPAAGRRPGCHLDGGRRPCAQPRADARQGFQGRLCPLHPQFRLDLERHEPRRSGREGEPARSVLDDEIGGKNLLVFKSDSHLSQDTNKHLPANGVLPNAVVWKQIIEEIQPKLVLTTGTSGGIGKDFEVGDVVVSPVVRFNSRKWLKSATFCQAQAISSKPAKARVFRQGQSALQGKRGSVAPRTIPDRPKIMNVSPERSRVIRRHDGFFWLRHLEQPLQALDLGDASEMGDAVLGMVASETGAAGPALAGGQQRLRSRDQRGPD